MIQVFAVIVAVGIVLLGGAAMADVRRTQSGGALDDTPKSIRMTVIVGGVLVMIALIGIGFLTV